MNTKYDIEYLPIAERDLIDIFDYIRQDNPSAAVIFINKIDKGISQLELFPKMGSVPKDDRLSRKGYRMLVVEDYLVFYVFLDDIVEIRRILHGSRKYSFLL